jgi:N6-adenosine-specific RNA methylase IME4
VGALIISEQKFEALLTFDVPSIAAGDCVLFLWATAPMEAQAHEVMTAWGFTYVTQVIWDKNADATVTGSSTGTRPSCREERQGPRARAWNAAALSDQSIRPSLKSSPD